MLEKGDGDDEDLDRQCLHANIAIKLRFVDSFDGCRPFEVAIKFELQNGDGDCAPDLDIQFLMNTNLVKMRLLFVIGWLQQPLEGAIEFELANGYGNGDGDDNKLV